MMARGHTESQSRLDPILRCQLLRLPRSNSSDYFFLAVFLALVAFLADLLFLAVALVDFFFPNAEDQLFEYFLLGPLRKMVIRSVS
ncbi:hypothetical protein MFFC18_25750 [Mariniblastus fucicola]|uniref:Uncharacterized protein n=1 Tax=Mariniblastus fucicola TaxID=980251 RepID=A0A5B9PCQ2_9BACT|nr:hypothetical protein MFFC18_25750 [Mariniblastus fucicola]